MPLETGTQIGDLDPTNPPGSDALNQADDHIRLVKTCIQGSLGNMEELWAIRTNDTPIRQRNFADTAYLDMIKVNVSDEIEIGVAGSPLITRSVLNFDSSSLFPIQIASTAVQALIAFADVGSVGTGVFVGSEGNDMIFGRRDVQTDLRINSIGQMIITEDVLMTGGKALFFNGGATTLIKDDEAGGMQLSSGDFKWFVAGVERMSLDSGANFNVSSFQSNGSNNGFQYGGAEMRTSRTETTNVLQYLFFNPNGNIGSISTNGSATAYNTSSDPMLKTAFAEFDGLGMIASAIDAGAVGEAGFLGDDVDNRYPMFDGQWLAINQPGTGGSRRDEDHDASMDYGKRTPVHEQAIYQLLERLEMLEGMML